MKLIQLFEDHPKPTVVTMLQRLMETNTPVYLLRQLPGGMEAGRILQPLDYTPPTDTLGGELTLRIAALDNDGYPFVKKLSLIQGLGEDGANEVDDNWTISTIDGRRLFHRRGVKQEIINLKDKIKVTEME